MVSNLKGNTTCILRAIYQFHQILTRLRQLQLLQLKLLLSLLRLNNSTVFTINPGAADPSSKNPLTPKEITVPAGTEISWINKDSTPHAIISGNPESGPDNIFYGNYFDTGKMFNTTLDEPGTYEFYDDVSRHIKGKITVTGDKPP